MPIALRVLAVHEEALRYDQMQIVLCACHRDIESRRSSSISADVPVPRSDGMQPSTTLSRTPISIPGPWRSGSSTGSGSPRRAAGRRPGRWWHPEDLTSARSGSVRGTDIRWRSVQAGAGPRGASPRPRGCGPDAVHTRVVRAPDRRPFGISQFADGWTNVFQSSPARGGGGMIASPAIGSAASAMCSRTRCADVGPPQAEGAAIESPRHGRGNFDKPQ